MNLTAVLEGMQQDLQALAELGDERAQQFARRLGDALGSNLRLRLQGLLAEAALEVSSKLPSGHVEVRLAGQEPELVYVEGLEEDAGGTAAASEELSARISLRLPDSLKAAAERAAAKEGVSTNTWLVRAIARAAESRPAQASGRRLSGYARS